MPKNGNEIAGLTGTRYDGVQEGIGMQFTDLITGSTTYGNTLNEVRDNLVELRARYSA